MSSMGAPEGDEEVGGFDKYMLRFASSPCTEYACEMPFVLAFERLPLAGVLEDPPLSGRRVKTNDDEGVGVSISDVEDTVDISPVAIPPEDDLRLRSLATVSGRFRLLLPLPPRSI